MKRLIPARCLSWCLVSCGNDQAMAIVGNGYGALLSARIYGQLSKVWLERIEFGQRLLCGQEQQ